MDKEGPYLQFCDQKYCSQNVFQPKHDKNSLKYSNFFSFQIIKWTMYASHTYTGSQESSLNNFEKCDLTAVLEACLDSIDLFRLEEEIL